MHKEPSERIMVRKILREILRNPENEFVLKKCMLEL